MTRTSRACVFGVLVALIALSGSLFNGSTARASSPAVANGLTWLRTQQQPDGGFEVAGFPGFETPDAVFAIAAAASPAVAGMRRPRALPCSVRSPRRAQPPWMPSTRS